MSQSIPTGYIPPCKPWGVAEKNLPGGRDLTFESCPGLENSTRAEILWKMKLKLQKVAWIKFLQVETKKKQVEFLTFFEVYCMCFFDRIFPGLWVNFLVLLSHIPYKKSEDLPLACLFEVFTGLWLSTPTFCIKTYDYVKHFLCVLVLSVINTGCLKKFLKNRYVVDFFFSLC